MRGAIPDVATLEEEPAHGEDYATREEARAGLFEYVEVFRGRVRRPSAPGGVSPADYGRAG